MQCNASIEKCIHACQFSTFIRALRCGESNGADIQQSFKHRQRKSNRRILNYSRAEFTIFWKLTDKMYSFLLYLFVVPINIFTIFTVRLLLLESKWRNWMFQNCSVTKLDGLLHLEKRGVLLVCVLTKVTKLVAKSYTNSWTPHRVS